MAKNYNIDDLENYLNGQLSDEERNSFQQELETDETLAAEVDFHQDILKGINNGASKDFRAMVGNVHGKLKTEGFFTEETATVVDINKGKSKVRSLQTSWVRGLAAAASIALLVSAMWWIFFQPVTPASVYANAYVPAPDVLSVELEDRLSETGFGLDKAALIGLQNGIKAYNSGDYGVARTQLIAFINDAPEDGLANYAKFYSGLSALEMNEGTAAINDLKELSNVANFELANDAQWYLGLAYLNTNNESQAMEIFNNLLDDIEYGVKAQSILNELY